MENKEFTKFAKHGAYQVLCYIKDNPEDIKKKVIAYSDKTGYKINNKNTIQKSGLIANETQLKVFYAIIDKLSDTNYKGHKQMHIHNFVNNFLIKKYPKVGSNFFYGTNESPYKNIPFIPGIIITQKELIVRAGYNPRKQRDKQLVVEALDYLATHQFYFFWDRAIMKDGKPEKNRDGSPKKEHIEYVGNILHVLKSRSDRDKLKYYEIYPSACLLDQNESYFMLIHKDWLDNITKKIKRRVSRYTLLFLFWLYDEADKMKRYNKKYEITKSIEEMAIILNMPESLYKKKKKEAWQIIQNAMQVAYFLGYIDQISIEEEDGRWTFWLNKDFYPAPGKLNNKTL